MAIIREDFHSVPNNTNVSTANAPNLSGVLINVGTGPGTAKGDSTNLIHGVNSLKVIGTVAASDVAYVFINGSDATGSMHDYVYFPGTVPSSACQLMVMRGVSSGPNVCLFTITSGNKFAIQDAGGVTKKTFADTVVANQLYRLELSCTPGTGTGDGTIQGAYYLDELTSLPAGETAYAASNVNAGTVAIGQYRFGKPNSGGTINYNLSDAAVNPGTLAEIGPIPTGTPFPIPPQIYNRAALIRAASW